MGPLLGEECSQVKLRGFEWGTMVLVYNHSMREVEAGE